MKANGADVCILIVILSLNVAGNKLGNTLSNKPSNKCGIVINDLKLEYLLIAKIDGLNLLLIRVNNK